MSSLIKVSEAASIAIHAMILLAADSDRTVSSKEMARQLGSSEAHLAKVMQRLAKAGLVGSTRGPKGGFVLKRPTGEISLLDVYEAIEGPLKETNCLLGRPVCNGESCIFGDLLKTIDRQAREYLSEKRLSDLECILNGTY